MSIQAKTCPDQTLLFEDGKIWSDPELGPVEVPCPISYGKQGSYMDVGVRAIHLLAALDAMSQRNIRKRFPVATYTMPKSTPIWGRYQENTPVVLAGAKRNREFFEQTLRINFWRATGFAAMRGKGVMREGQINPRAEKMWDDFNEMYGHPKKRKARNKYKVQLLKFIPRPEEASESEAA